jgi:putative transposase
MHHHPQRKHPRLRGYDYRTPGRYFVTSVTAGRKMMFGRVVGGGMRLGEMGRIVDEEWRRTAEVRPDVQIDALVVMPNHVHAIVAITADAHPDTIVGAQRAAPAPRPGSDDVERPVVAPGSLGAIVRAAKSASSRRINELRGTPGARYGNADSGTASSGTTRPIVGSGRTSATIPGGGIRTSTAPAPSTETRTPNPPTAPKANACVAWPILATLLPAPHSEESMGKTATARARMEPEVKDEAERILEECGLSASEAIGMFYRQVILHHGLPFSVQNFNEETRKVLKASEQGLEVTRFDSSEALFEDLGI